MTMTLKTTWRRAAACQVLALAALVAASGCARSAPEASEPVELAVAGRASATPWVAAQGEFVAAAWGASADGKTDVFVAVSRDGGRTFGYPVQVDSDAGDARLGGELPPRVDLVAVAGGSDPGIVVTWTARGETTAIKTAKSVDGGKTFNAPVMLQSAGAAGDRGWPALTVDRAGVAHAIWLDHRGLAAAGAGGHDHHAAGAGDGAAMAQRSGLFYASVNGAVTSERELAKGVCYCCKTTIVSAPDGTIYAAWRHVYPGNIRDIAFAVSRDGGRTFSSPVRVSEDGWELQGCPDDGPAMAVDARGTVHIVWPTVIQGERPEGALFYASTRDGLMFTPRVRVPTLGSPKPWHPQVVTSSDGRVFVAWDESLEGRRVAAVREVAVDADGSTSFGDVVMLDAPAMYPVLASSGDAMVAAWTVPGDTSRVMVQRLPWP